MKVICLKCNKLVDYTITKTDAVTTINQEEIGYSKQIATCNECGAEVYVESVADYNGIEPFKVYATKHPESMLACVLYNK